MLRWLNFPPFLSAVLLIVSSLTKDPGLREKVPSMIWGMTAAMYVCVCGISLARIIRGGSRDVFAISLLGQGVLVGVISVSMGAIGMAWFMLLLFLVGLILIFLASTKAVDAIEEMVYVPQASDDVSVEQILSKLELPVCYTDETGLVEEATESFLEAVDRSPAEIIGESITSIISDEPGEMMLATGKWYLDVVRSGKRRYFHLKPTPDGKPAKADQKKKSNPAEVAFVDAETGLYSAGYLRIRGPEEVARAQRYKRPLSSILLELTFEGSSASTISSDQMKMLKVAFAQKVREVLRETDCGFLTENSDQILLLLPETQQQGAKSFISRLLLLPQDAFDEDLRMMLAPRVIAGMFYVGGSNAQIDYGAFTASLDQAFENAKANAAA